MPTRPAQRTAFSLSGVAGPIAVSPVERDSSLAPGKWTSSNMVASLAMVPSFKPLFVLRLTAHDTVSGVNGILGAVAQRVAGAMPILQEPLHGTASVTSQQLLAALIAMERPYNPKSATMWAALRIASGWTGVDGVHARYHAAALRLGTGFERRYQGRQMAQTVKASPTNPFLAKLTSHAPKIAFGTSGRSGHRAQEHAASLRLECVFVFKRRKLRGQKVQTARDQGLKKRIATIQFLVLLTAHGVTGAAGAIASEQKRIALKG